MTPGANLIGSFMEIIPPRANNANCGSLGQSSGKPADDPGIPEHNLYGTLADEFQFLCIRA
jgi:hypothetical protein